MKLEVKIKDRKEPIVYIGDKIDILDFCLEGIEYKQIRVFKGTFSKSELILKSIIKNLKEIKN